MLQIVLWRSHSGFIAAFPRRLLVGGGGGYNRCHLPGRGGPSKSAMFPLRATPTFLLRRSMTKPRSSVWSATALIGCLANWLVPLPATAQSISAPTAPSSIDFNRDIKSILSNNCFKCHGPDAAERKGGLRLDTAEGATADLGGYAAVLSGKPEQSELVTRVISTDPDLQMPPPDSGKKLSPHEIELLRQWVSEGGKYAGHWSYAKPIRHQPPAVRDSDTRDGAWPRNELDYFILARLEREGLSPSPPADRAALVRRASLDITGLPPSEQDVEKFVNDVDPLAYEKLVDRLLRSPGYGEHWARMWLDLARYADSAGYADDPPRTIWLYRDYVIRALNANMPFDQFTIEQIAGDLLPEPTEDQLIATAFHRNTLTNNEGGTNDEEFRNVAVVDRVNTTMAVWMGTTIACAQCHNHKYDPISQEEFFRFFAFFNNSQDADRGDESPLLPVYSDEQSRQRSQWQTALADADRALTTPTPELAAAQSRWEESFPLNLEWQVAKPAAVKTQSGLAATVADDGAVAVAAGAKNDTYTVEAPLAGGALRALRLEALADDSLPGKGPGYAGGNFVVTRITATVTAPASASPTARYVRIELPGKEKILSLAEVQVFRGTDNVAPRGEASQSSTLVAGEAKRAIDGNTDGRYADANSTTHTAVSESPWWEVDLKTEQPLDRIIVWNRTDGGLEDRLAGYHLIALNDRRETVWRQEPAAAPKPSAEFALGGPQPIELATATADYFQPNFEPANVLDNKDPKKKGWAVGGQSGHTHTLSLIGKSPFDVKAGSTLSVTIEQASQFENHTIGRFRLSFSGDERAAEFVATPPAVLEALHVPATQRTPEQAELLAGHYRSIAAELQPARDRAAELRKQLADTKPITVPVVRELPEGQRRKTQIQHRGNFLDLGPEVVEGTPAAFPALPTDAPRNRLTLARWLVDDANPLTGRVIANRYWEQIFGIGIVASSEEFGSQGEPPSHPELLDWLATELVRSHWDMKAFVRLLVTSAAYRQSSRVTPELDQRDPDNRLLARGPRFRMSAEMVRDQALAISGLLSDKMYGPPVKPPQPSLGLNAAFGGAVDWQTSAGDDRYRRAIYTTWRRSSPYPSMATFDAPNREVCTVRRVRTNTPLQALVTLNDPVYVEAAQALARRTLAGGSTVDDRARHAFRLCLCRPPHDEELARLVGLYQQTLAALERTPDAAHRLATEPLGAAPPGTSEAELAAWTVVGNVLLNLDETLMKR
jgi:mono/diheme cytochrome c family protein